MLFVIVVSVFASVMYVRNISFGANVIVLIDCLCV